MCFEAELVGIRHLELIEVVAGLMTVLAVLLPLERLCREKLSKDKKGGWAETRQKGPLDSPCPLYLCFQ